MKIIIVTLAFCLTTCTLFQGDEKPYPRPIIDLNPTPTSLSQIVFGSCLDQDKPQTIWPAIFAAQPELFIFTGDNVYARSNDIPDLVASYQTLARSEWLYKLTQRSSVLATWDDHDYGLNDGGADFPHKEIAKSHFVNFWNFSKKSVIHQRPGIYYAKTFGQGKQTVQIIFLDTRSFRSPLTPSKNPGPGHERYVSSQDPQKTLLGQRQWQWLKQQLTQPATIRIIVSGIQFVAVGHGWEKWDNLPLERNRMVKLLSTTKANGVIFISGDRHVAGIYKLKTPALPYPIYDITASGLNKRGHMADENGPLRLGPIYNKINFGLIKINWASQQLVLSIQSETNQPVLSQTLTFQGLSPPGPAQK